MSAQMPNYARLPGRLAREAYAEAEDWVIATGERSEHAREWFKVAMHLYALAADEHAHSASMLSRTTRVSS